jgi:hypothetical protein
VEQGDGLVLEARNIESARELETVFLDTFDIEPPIPAAGVFDRLGSS